MTRLNKIFFSSALFLAVSSVQAQSVPEPREIIAGSTTSIENYPWMASLYIPSASDPEMGGSCGGTLIDSNWILTAGHCFLNDSGTAVDLSRATQVIVTLNTSNIDSPAMDAVFMQSADLIVHPEYKPWAAQNSNDNDIALLRLSQSVTSIQPVTLSSTVTSSFTNGQALKAMGWGATEVNQFNESINPSDTLKEVDLQYMDNTTCANIYSDGITRNMVCANGLNNSNDTCQGDSGGPLVIPVGEGYQQIGISSFGGLDLACGDPEVPGVYARVSQYESFIKSYVPDAQFSSSSSSDETLTDNCAPTLDSNLNVGIQCLSFNGQAYQTGLTHLGSLKWQWSGVLSESRCSVNNTICATIDDNLNLQVPNINYQGATFTVLFDYDTQTSTPSQLRWGLGGTN